MKNSNEEIQKIIDGAGVLAESASIFYKQFRSAGLPNDVATHLTGKVIENMMNVAYLKSREENI